MAAIEGKLAKLRAEAHDAREWMISQVTNKTIKSVDCIKLHGSFSTNATQSCCIACCASNSLSVRNMSR